MGADVFFFGRIRFIAGLSPKKFPYLFIGLFFFQKGKGLECFNLEALDLWEKLNLYMAACRRNLEEHERESKRRKGPKGFGKGFGGAFGQAENVKGVGVSCGVDGEFFFGEHLMHMSWNTYSFQT